MQHSTSVRPWPAILAAAFFAGVTGYVLFEDVARHGAPINTKHVMTLAVLLGTICFGHWFGPQAKAWRILPAAGCAILFVGGTYMCVFMAAGRNAEAIQAKNATARKLNTERAGVEAETDTAKADRERTKRQHAEALDAQKAADADVRVACATGKGGKCKGAVQTAEVAALRVAAAADAVSRADAHYWELVGRLAATDPARVENGDVKALAAVYAKLPWVQASAETIEATHILLLPIGMALFAEIGLIVSLSIREQRAVRKVQKPEPIELDEPKGGEPAKPAPKPMAPPPNKGRPMTKEEVEAYLVTQLALGRELPSQDWLREQCGGLSKATASDWVKDWRRRGLVETVRSGHCHVIRAGRKLQPA